MTFKPTAASWPLPRISSRFRSIGLACASGAVLMTLYALKLRQEAPDHTIGAFLHAARAGDAAAMLALADPSETKRLGLTPQKLATILEAVSGIPNGPVFGVPNPHPLNPQQSRYNYLVDVNSQVRDGHQFNFVPNTQARISILAYKTDSGWRIALSKHLYALALIHHGRKGIGQRYYAVCQQNGISPLLFGPEIGSWHRFNPNIGRWERIEP